ncbi:MAG: 4Fe-4S binding protein [Anaerotruncus sp.]|nr:4Fe-4S binding protein [Anaerotruncus sp.]
MIDLPKLCEAVGIKRVRTVDPYKLDETEAALREEVAATEVSVVISLSPCMLIPAAKAVTKPLLKVNLTKCSGCKTCFKVARPGIAYIVEEGEFVNREGKTKKRKGHAQVDKLNCTGCKVCAQVCPNQAIEE